MLIELCEEPDAKIILEFIESDPETAKIVIQLLESDNMTPDDAIQLFKTQAKAQKQEKPMDFEETEEKEAMDLLENEEIIPKEAMDFFESEALMTKEDLQFLESEGMPSKEHMEFFPDYIKEERNIKPEPGQENSTKAGQIVEGKEPSTSKVLVPSIKIKSQIGSDNPQMESLKPLTLLPNNSLILKAASLAAAGHSFMRGGEEGGIDIRKKRKNENRDPMDTQSDNEEFGDVIN